MDPVRRFPWSGGWRWLGELVIGEMDDFHGVVWISPITVMKNSLTVTYKRTAARENSL
jgi:hypothetical protein